MKEFLKKIVQSDSKESSKRLGFLWTLLLITIVTIVIVWRNPTQRILLLSTLVGLAVTLAGIGAYEKRKLDNNDKK